MADLATQYQQEGSTAVVGDVAVGAVPRSAGLIAPEVLGIPGAAEDPEEPEHPEAPADAGADAPTGRLTPCRPPLPPHLRGPLGRARALLAAHPVVDGCNGLPWALRQHTGRNRKPGHRLALDRGETRVRTDIPRLRAGGVGGQFWSLQVPSELTGAPAAEATLAQIRLVRALVRSYPDALRLALCADDVTEAHHHGRIASLLGPASGHALDSSLDVLRTFHRRGVRALELTGDHNTPWADSATDEPKAGGLTPFGEEVVREMNRLGMLVDLSAGSADTMRHALAVSRAPVFWCQAAARSVTDHPRNIPDEVLAQLARNGGVCMVTFRPERIVCGTAPASVQHIADHLDHVRAVAGPDHVGLGAGFDTDPATVHRSPLPDVAGYPQLIAELIDRGWSFRDLAGLTRGNALRALRGAEAAARSLRGRRVPSKATIERLDGARV
ncbi:dipeptidase [Streptomyces sp. NPDC017993]|uniref:dipeptidase n=1 Tax=Streptomyces sp. NPDC017993 TaxID=3365027 RepID=UPI0037A5A4E7